MFGVYGVFCAGAEEGLGVEGVLPFCITSSFLFLDLVLGGVDEAVSVDGEVVVEKGVSIRIGVSAEVGISAAAEASEEVSAETGRLVDERGSVTIGVAVGTGGS